MKKIMICGSRSINDENLIFEKLNAVLVNNPDMILVSGGAKGVGEATTKAVVWSFVTIVIWDLVFSIIFFF